MYMTAWILHDREDRRVKERNFYVTINADDIQPPDQTEQDGINVSWARYLDYFIQQERVWRVSSRSTSGTNYY